MPASSGDSALSRDWYAYFVSNRSSGDDLPWDCPHQLTEDERRTISKSIQQFQLGERAEGRRLLERGRAWSATVGDACLVRVLGLFIKEEQRHSRLLSRFMRRERIPELTSHWLDGIFRRIRVLAGLELELRVLVTAEIIAVPYYRALGAATESQLLRWISDTILADEAAHLRFQKTMLSRLGSPRSPALRCLVWQLHRLLLAGTCCVVWIEHRAVFKAAEYSFGKFLEEALGEISALEAPSTVPRGLAKTGRATAVAADG
jgi:rubrerythrin